MNGTDFSDETLMAYADGELDPAAAAAVTARRAADPGLDGRIRLFEDTARVARDALDHIAREPVPIRLLAATRPAGSLWARLPDTRPLVALAASLMLAVGLGAGYMAAQLWGNQQAGAVAGLAVCGGAGLSNALEIAATGERSTSGGCAVVPVASYRDDRGTVCRAFQATAGDGPGRSATAGIACRDDGAWRTRIAVDLAAGTGAGDAYRPASGPDAGLSGLRGAIGLRAAALSPAEERRLLQNGWQQPR